jgi:hypothetical protein
MQHLTGIRVILSQEFQGNVIRRFEKWVMVWTLTITGEQ